jgi:Ca-activated chloride channel homolog
LSGIKEMKGKNQMRTQMISKQCKILFVLFFSLWLGADTMAQAYRSEMKKGEKAYDAGDYEGASENFKSASGNKERPDALFNLGNSKYKQGDFEEAARHFQKSADAAIDPKLKSKSYFNLGNSLLEDKKADEAIDAYKEAIRLNPADSDAKNNLLLARQVKQQQQQQQQNDNSDQDQKQDQNQQNTQDNKDQNKDQEKDEEQQELPQSTEQLLKAIEDEEQKVQQKLRNKQQRPNKSTKEW